MPTPGDWMQIKIHQRYVSGGNYGFFVEVDGQEMVSVINIDARQFYNVKVYTSDPWHHVQGSTKNLKLTNFL